MESLAIKLQKLGFSDEYIEFLNETKQYDTATSAIPNISFQNYEQEIISTTELEITISPSSDTNYIIGYIGEDELPRAF